MTWQEARRFAAQHCVRLKLPRRMDGLKVSPPVIAGPPGFARMVRQSFTREVRKRGGVVEFEKNEQQEKL